MPVDALSVLCAIAKFLLDAEWSWALMVGWCLTALSAQNTTGISYHAKSKSLLNISISDKK